MTKEENWMQADSTQFPEPVQFAAGILSDNNKQKKKRIIH